MPEINEHLEKIINGVYGQEIRGSIYDAINTINNSINNMGNLHFTIAPSNAVNKHRADLVLTGVPADDLAAINQAIIHLHYARANADAAIRIDFMGGNIDLGTKTDGSAIVIHIGYDNIHLYGNGVKITGDVYDESYTNMYSVLDSSGNNCTLDGFVVDNTSFEGYGLYSTGANCTITGNTCSSGDSGLFNYGTKCVITGNTCSSGDSGLFNYGTKCVITGNTCSSNYSHGLYNEGGSCTITGNTCSSSGEGAGLYNSGTKCVITGNICSSNNEGLSNAGANCIITGNTCSSNGDDFGLFCGTSSTVNKCIIIGNVCLNGGISVKEGTCLPATQDAIADVNTGTITLR